MIENLKIKKVATYEHDGGEMENLKKLNFIFGANGTGKTTISKFISGLEPEKFEECGLNWAGGRPLSCFVYNRDFVKCNFHSENLLKGIFTLGEEDNKIAEALEKLKEEKEEIEEKQTGLQRELQGCDGNGGKIGARDKAYKSFKDNVWPYRQQYGEVFSSALEGALGKKRAFADRLLREAQDKSAELHEQSYLEERATSVFAEGAEFADDKIEMPDVSELLEAENNPILGKKVIGKEDVDIAAMIQRLNNSDWVQEGLAYFEKNDEHCPFCQRKTNQGFHQSLNDYFDEAYNQDIGTIKRLGAWYKEEAEKLIARYEAAKSANNPFLELSAYQDQLDLFVEKAAANKNLLHKKEDEPSTLVELTSLSAVTDKLKEHLESAKKKATEHNELIKNRRQEQDKLKREVWRFIINEAQAHINAYHHETSDLDKAIKHLNDQLDQCGKDLAANTESTQELEKKTTSIKPTVDAINKLLSSFGFEGFKLDEADEKTGFYKIVRPDGKDAHQSLSEGEKTFITFLYFYHLLKGSDNATGVQEDRIAVFDDPISSLDSEVLFIVSTLIKDIINEARNDSLIKQVFVLTHNVYFHKEVTYKEKKDAGFWLVSKRENISRIDRANGNPVKSAYEMLWLELEEDNLKPLTVRNTLRRILEYYFKMIGGMKLEDLPFKFDDSKDQLACRALLSWVHDGSHCFDDDINVITGDEDAARYLRVFQMIFKKTDHIGHYEMMKGKASSSAEKHYKGAT